MEQPGTSPPVIYDVDAKDRITSVNDGWVAFALRNNGEAVLPPGIIGWHLWDSIADPTTIELYRMLYARVRSRREPVTFAFRCDSPDTRRVLEMRLEPGAGASIRSVVRLLTAQDRQSVPLFDAHAERSDGLVTVCSWCKRIQAGNVWLEVEEAVPRMSLLRSASPPMLTHGICGACNATMFGEFSDGDAPAPGAIVLGALGPA